MKKSMYIAMAIVALLSGCSPKPRLLMPADGTETSQNMPTLAWKGVECDYYEVIVNDIVVEKVPGYKSTSTAFPLSYGENTWQVRAVKGGSARESEKRVIRVSDGTLSPLPQRSQLLREGWAVQSSAVVGRGLPEATEGWYKTSIPATVLTALVRNGVYPNPYVGMNNMQIPDSDDEYNEDYDLLRFSHIPGKNPWKDPYWFTTCFTLSEELRSAKHVELNFREINYRADIYLNGQPLADKEQAVGMERHLQYDVTDIVKRDSENTLAVLIYPVDHPGKPEVEPLTALANPGQNMGDGMISHDYAKWDTMGWDWIPAVRDRDMGITEEVFLAGDDGLAMANVYVSAEPDLAQSGKAAVAISLDLKNFSDSEKAGELKLSIKGHGTDIALSKPYRVAAGSCQSVTLDASEFAELELSDAKLWWPVGYGEPNLYEYSLTADADIQSGHFGIRKVESRMGASAREFFINGRRIYPVGGNWVIDMMLNWTPSRYEKEILLSKNAGLNMLRVWGPTGVAPDALFDAADRHGILMWQDFLNDFWGTFRNRPGYQPELALYREISTGIVKRLRNHPSLIIWCGGNEGVNPREEMLVNEILAQEDSRTSRFYLSASDGDGLHGGGPYNTIQPEEYFTHQKLSGFSSEIGPSGLPVWQSADKFLLGQEGEAAVGRFPLDGQFAYHDANDWPGQDKRKFHTYDDMVRGWYGSIDSIDSTDFRKACKDYFAKAQFVNYDVYKAAVESINRQLWDGACGIMLWKSNSAWPSMVWQLYDW
ncbi:MAG: beta galactosidase jelly roll domain-containing protein, partial [Bacteroidales bacterium]|nr:beta galactosidase jelly roll domain-containing protein [Bacteroidales bacterium]